SSAAYFRVLPASVPQRVSMRALRPSVQPNCCSACTNAVLRACPSGSSAAKFMNRPIGRTRSVCCARAARGQATAAPPISAMNARRFIRHLVGAQYETGWNLMTDGFRGLEVDDQLVAIWYFHRNVGRLGAAQDLHRNSRPLTVHVGKAWAVAGKRAGFRGFRPLEDRWQAHCCDAFHHDLVVTAART